MKRIVWAGVALAGALVLGVVAGAAWIFHTLQSPDLHAAILQRVRAAVGTDVRVGKVEVSLLSGVRLRGIGVANPPPFQGELMTAEALVLRYRLLPLLAGRVQVDRLTLDRPRLAVAMDARGSFSYEKLGSSTAPAPGAEAARAAGLPLRIVLSRLSVENGTLVMTDPTRAQLLAIGGADVESALDVAAGRVTGSGKAGAARVNLGGLLVEKLQARFELQPGSLSFAPIRGELAGGRVEGHALVRFEKGFRYSASVKLAGSRVETLLEQMRSAASLTGRLEARAEIEGSGGLATMRAHGEGRVADCRVRDSRTLRLLSSVLGVAELANPELDECRAEFRQTGLVLRTPVLSLKGRTLEIAGRGALNLATSGLDYDLTLALGPRLFAMVPRRAVRGAFATRPDGFASIAFHLSGTTLDPKTDLLARIGRGAAEQIVGDQLRRLFGGARRP